MMRELRLWTAKMRCPRTTNQTQTAGSGMKRVLLLLPTTTYRAHDFIEAGGELHPDARLIAAAPEMLQALQLIECVYRKNVVKEGEPSSVLDELQRVIAKATKP